MYSLLLVIIYIAFISLGLPDSLTGSAWPVMYRELNVPVSYMGILTMIVSGGTVISSLMSDRLTRRLGTGPVTAASVLLTAVALFGYSVSGSFVQLCLWAVPYGLGAGAVDASLNNYVALHYKSRHMSWLHCFWGVGCSVSPYIMSYCLTGFSSWQLGYRSVAVLQFVLTTVLFLSLPLWKASAASLETAQAEHAPGDMTLLHALRIKGVLPMLTAFFCYSALEATAAIWASSYLVQYRGIAEVTAARFASLFYLGITVGRFLSGFVSERLGDRRLIRLGTGTILLGILLILLPLPSEFPALAGLIVVGFGCAPIYPSIIHSTPENFGKENSQAIIGIQMAGAYVGSTFMPPLFGLLAKLTGIGLYPVFLLFFCVLMLFTSELQRKITAH